MTVPAAGAAAARKVVFISKATPGDDEFTIWLAPRLEVPRTTRDNVVLAYRLIGFWAFGSAYFFAKSPPSFFAFSAYVSNLKLCLQCPL
jgi:hypothetical protein